MTTLPSSVAAPGDLLRARQAVLAEDLVARQFAAHPGLLERYGPAGRAKCLEDANYHLSFLADSLNAASPSLFTSYIAWAKVMLARRGIPVEDLARNLEFTKGALREGLPPAESVLALEYVDAALDGLQSMPADIPTFLRPEAPQGALARAYLDALLAGDRHTATRLVLDAVASGVPVRDIYLHVFQPSQYEIGRLWQTNAISVGQEHYCTAATQMVMSQLYPHVFSTEKSAGTFVGACVAGDLHEIGARMVSDFLEMEGWHTFYLGANTPGSSIVETVVGRRANVLGLSATMSSNLGALRTLIAEVRRAPECADVRILAGGYPFAVMPDLWRTIGADGSAPDALQAAVLARRLTSRTR